MKEFTISERHLNALKFFDDRPEVSKEFCQVAIAIEPKVHISGAFAGRLGLADADQRKASVFYL
uniref:Uncharacterized protein n=1 Tax=Romanomermis culicivorax TaxID=13658 RepID=A0A915L4C8_ROMCU